ncbi:MAG: hypothetical protein IJ272_09580, partial [Clostridia bacterium]|nr:hypothetical protein [Clostridia bacterium]
MENVFVAIMFIIGFVGVPMIMLYVSVYKRYQKIKRCSVDVVGKILSLKEERRVTYSSEGSDVNYYIIANCEYEYEGKKYEGEVEYRRGRCKLEEGQLIDFKINPSNPYETYVRFKKDDIRSVALAVFLCLFMVVGVVSAVRIVLPEKENTSIDKTVAGNKEDKSSVGTQNKVENEEIEEGNSLSQSDSSNTSDTTSSIDTNKPVDNKDNINNTNKSNNTTN